MKFAGIRETFCSPSNISVRMSLSRPAEGELTRLRFPSILRWNAVAAWSGTKTPLARNAVAVNATLYYQSIPPYYLRQRSADAHGPDTARLITFTNQLKTTQYPEIANWKLKIATSGPVKIQ
jgi:hypothetical protein